MVGWHHWLNGHEFEQAPGDSEGQGSLVCCSPQGRRELDMTERLIWSDDLLYFCGIWLSSPFKFLILLIWTLSLFFLVVVVIQLLSHVQLFATTWTTPVLPAPHYLLEFAPILLHWVGDAIPSSHPLLPFSPFAFNLSQCSGLFQWVGSSHQVAKY